MFDKPFTPNYKSSKPIATDISSVLNLLIISSHGFGFNIVNFL